MVLYGLLFAFLYHNLSQYPLILVKVPQRPFSTKELILPQKVAKIDFSTLDLTLGCMLIVILDLSLI
jgi:hypothetical protein